MSNVSAINELLTAINFDWGVCCNKASPNDGRMVFEHAGCTVHSALVARSSIAATGSVPRA